MSNPQLKRACLLGALLGAGLASQDVAAQAADLFFSEYVEGSSNNKAIEIYNGTGAAVDLSVYTVELYANGAASPGNTQALSGTLADGDVFVITNSGAALTEITSNSDLTSSVTFFNGDDALVLKKSGVVIDRLGQVGFDPGSEWGTGNASTLDNTIRRKSDICEGDTAHLSAFDPSVQWDGYPNNTVEGIGAHTANCTTTPELSIADVSQLEGDSDSSTFTFTISLSAPAAAGGVTFDIATADDSATAGEDYVASSANGLSIAEGESSTTFAVTVNGDTAVEGNERFFVNVSNVVGANVADDQADGTIQNDDASSLPGLSISDASIAEGNGGTTTLSFTVSLNAPAGVGGVSFDVDSSDALVDDSATAGIDYVALSQDGLSIAEGETQTTVDVSINGDVSFEADEQFVLTVSNVSGADLIGAQATGTILNDDVSLSLADANLTEGDQGSSPLNFVATLSGPLGSDLTITANTSNGSATAGDASPADYQAISNGEFVIAAGQTSVQIPVTVFGDISDENDETFNLSIAASGVDLLDGEAIGTITDNDSAAVEIHAIQGNGLRSPFAPASGNTSGQAVTTSGNIVTAVLSNGFTMQTPDGRIDGDLQTSQGLFVFTGLAPGVSVGQTVTVKGAVAEYYNFTQLTSATVVIDNAGASALPTAIVWDQNTPSPDPTNLSCGATLGNFECFEGMRVSVPVGVVATGNQTFGTDPYAEAYVSAVGTRSRREAGVRFGLSGTNGQAVWDGNPEIFELDADRIISANANLELRGGASFEATGVVGYDFGNHELWPTEMTVLDDVQRGVPANLRASAFTIGSFNVLRLCSTANCASTSGDPTEQEIAAKQARLSAYVRDVLRSPAVLGVQEVETLELLQQLATQIASDGGPTYTAYLAEGNDVGGIDNGFLVNEALISNVSLRQLGLTDQITDANGCSGGAAPCTLHDRPPYMLRGVFSAAGVSQPFAVVNNHTRSRGSVDSGSESGRVRLKRYYQALAIAQIAQRFQSGEELEPTAPTGDTATADIPLFLVGDYNAFEVTDGWVDVVGLIAGSYDNAENEISLSGGQVVNPPLLQTSSLVDIEARYSYTYAENYGNIQAQEPRRAGQAQILDHGFANAVAAPLVRGMAYGRLNADAPARLISAGSGAEGSSDHDGFVIYVDVSPMIFNSSFED
ncbi:Calx-beta domain-containing protein [Pseudomarimonas arenosa]|uniref:Lamin tail domain-containing protein n=1 Tax=Pseudomarimonas arenosa TaxID=2774145 RepID=A0AAW3ZII3_9GAMM|nr:Calx-beta domain-containing protein [Pseudomarimonas arenosa]MBD8525808.1 lamin tail domain-containing protein [Pseudomarimonas arenosa]